MKYVPVICPYCGCGCSFYLKVDHGKMVGTVPSDSHSVSQGRLCVKGWTAWEMIQHPDRLRSPLIRKGGRLVEASWDAALDLVAERLLALKNTHGPDCLGLWASARCSNELNYLAQKFCRAVLGTNNVDHCARTCHSPTVAGLVRSFGSGAMTNSIDEIKGAACIFAIGANVTEAHPLIGWRVRTAKDRGARLVVADPRRTDLADMADVHLQHYPGTDIALLNGLMHIIVRRGLHDEEFIKTRTEGFDELWNAVKAYPPERVARITGVGADQLVEAAVLYASHKPASILYTLGITEHTTGVDNVMSVANLAMITGNVGRESSGVNPLRGQSNVQGACDMGALPNVYPGYQKVEAPEVRAKFQQAWDVSLSAAPGLTTTDMLLAAGRGDLKALYVIGEDPMRSDPNIRLVRRTLESLEFLVVHEIFLSATCELAHVVLPGAGFAEYSGSYTNSERRVQFSSQAADPLPGCRPDWEILCDVATRMGHPMSYTDPSKICDEMASLTPIYGGISFERITPEGRQWPCPTKDHAGTQFLHRDRFARGLGKFHAIEDRPPAEVPDTEYPFVLSTGRMLFHYNAGSMTRRVGVLRREFPRNFVMIHPSDAKRLGIAGGRPCVVATRRGRLTFDALVTDKIKPGVLWMPFHFEEAPTNELTNDAFCPISRTGEYKACAARVAPV